MFDIISDLDPFSFNLRYNGFMMLAELLQSGNSIMQMPRVVPHPDEIISAPVQPMQDAVENPDSPVNENEFHIRENRDQRVSEFREILRRISTRLNERENNEENADQPQASGSAGASAAAPPAPNPEREEERPRPRPRRRRGHRVPIGPDDTTEEDDTDEDESRGFLLIPRNHANGTTRPRIFTFRTQRSLRHQSANLNRADTERIPDDARIDHNIKRLTHFLQESNSESV